MVVVSVMYPSGAKFDETYYLEKHMPMARKAEGLVEARVMRCFPNADGSAPPYAIITELVFPSMADVQKGMSGSQEMMADVVNFTDSHPVVMVGEVIG